MFPCLGVIIVMVVGARAVDVPAGLSSLRVCFFWLMLIWFPG